jgi:hypothetical protein
MSKAEDRACQYTGYCKNQSYSDFLNGYHQAEKDLELTWEDMRELYIMFAEVDVEIELCKADIQAETLGYYQEVLKRFKDLKNGTTKR